MTDQKKSVVVELFEDGAVRVATPHPASLEFIRRALGTLAPTDDSQALRSEVERLNAEVEALREVNRAVIQERDVARLEVGKLDARLAAAERHPLEEHSVKARLESEVKRLTGREKLLEETVDSLRRGADNAEATLARIRSRVGVTLWNLLAQEAHPWEGRVLDFELGSVPSCYLPPAPK